MEQLTLEVLAPYLPYNLQLQRLNKDDRPKLIHMNNGNIMYAIEHPDRCKPILRPLEDLGKKIIIDGKEVILINELSRLMERQFDINSQLHQFCNLLIDQHEWCHPKDYIKFINFFFKHHLDVFELIPHGLGISIHDIK